MQLGVVVAGDPWRFFKDIFQDLEAHHKVSVFERRRFKAPLFHVRINRYIFHRDLEAFMAAQDVVFFEWASDLLAVATRLPKKTKIVVRLHRYEMFQWADKINWANVDRLILVSQAMQQKFSERFPEHAHKTVVINESVSTEKFQPVTKPFQGDIGTLCFHTPRKRVYELILAFADLDKIRPGFHLHIGGSSHKDGDYSDAIQGVVHKLGLEDKVTFYGEVKEPWNWYQNVDIFISNSFSEGLQVAPMEAMASGRYCLSHHWDGADELLPASQLFLTDAQLHAKILEFTDLPESEKQRLQAEMRQRACERFDLKLIKSQIREVIEEVGQTVAVTA